MAEAFKADANGVGDNEMVMKGHAHYRLGLFYVTRYRNISALWFCLAAWAIMDKNHRPCVML